jgi:hypothetical protein
MAHHPALRASAGFAIVERRPWRRRDPPRLAQFDFNQIQMHNCVSVPCWEGERPMIRTRLPVLGAIALFLMLIFNYGVAVAEPNQTSADYVMPGCRDAASLITFSNDGESEEQGSLMAFCAGIVLASASWVSLTEYVFPRERLLSKPPVSSFSISTDSPRGFTRTSTVLPLRLCEQIGSVR